MQIKRNTQFLFAAIRPCRWFSLKGLIYPIFQNFLSQIFATTTIQCGVSGISFVLLAALGKIINSSWKLSPDYFDEFGWGGNFEKHFFVFCVQILFLATMLSKKKKKKERETSGVCVCLRHLIIPHIFFSLGPTEMIHMKWIMEEKWKWKRNYSQSVPIVSSVEYTQ